MPDDILEAYALQGHLLTTPCLGVAGRCTISLQVHLYLGAEKNRLFLLFEFFMHLHIAMAYNEHLIIACIFNVYNISRRAMRVGCFYLLH